MTEWFPPIPNPLPTTQATTAHTDASITAATGASQVIVPANPDRRELVLHNFGNKDWWINPTGGTAVASTPGNIILPKGGGTITLNNTNAVSGIATAGASLTVLEG